jgi:hypothetical protein
MHALDDISSRYIILVSNKARPCSITQAATHFQSNIYILRDRDIEVTFAFATQRRFRWVDPLVLSSRGKSGHFTSLKQWLDM